jgi:small subunit ribosomal protein S2
MDIATGQPKEAISTELEEMLNAGVFYGGTKTKTHPRMRQFITANRGGVEIIDLEKTLEMLQAALQIIEEKFSAKRVLLLGTQPQAQNQVKALAQKYGLPYVTVRWLGGTLTNFDVISKRLEWYKKLKEDKASGVFEKYTKKEQLDISKEIERLTPRLEGIEPMTEKPNLLIVIDPLVHTTAMREAKRLGIPVVSIVSTDYDPHEVSYPVVANTKARASIDWFLGRVDEALERGVAKATAVVKQEEASKKTETTVPPQKKANE